MSGPLRVGLVGVGQRGLQHVNAMVQMQKDEIVHITALADPYPENLTDDKITRFVPDYSSSGIKMFDTADYLIESGLVDAIWFVIPPNQQKGDIEQSNEYLKSARKLAKIPVKKTGQLDNTLIVVTGDHGLYYAESPREKLQIGTRTHYEDIEVPMLLCNSSKDSLQVGMIDSMGVTATFIDALNITPDVSFKGVSALKGGRDFVISESCGHGDSDLIYRDIYFTVTTPSHKMMAVIQGKKLHIEKVYDKITSHDISVLGASNGNTVNTIREFESFRDFFTSSSLVLFIDVPFMVFFIIILWSVGGMVALVPTLIAPLVILVSFPK